MFCYNISVKRKGVEKMKKIETIIVILSVAFLLWGSISWAEIVLKNITGIPTYSTFNLFLLLIK